MKKIALVVVLASILAACGGGGDDKDGNPASGTITVDQIAGTWVTECENRTNGSSQPISAREKYVFLKNSSTTFQIDAALSKTETYSSTNCTGSVVDSQPLENGGLQFTIAGQKTIDGKTVSKISGAYKGGTWKDVIYSSGNKIYFGATDSTDPVDSDGYPVKLDMGEYLTSCGDCGVNQGGTSSAGTINVDQLVGAWVTQCETGFNELDQPVSVRAKFVIVKKSSTSFQIEASQSRLETFNSANCTGNVVLSESLDKVANEISIVGQKTIDGKTVSKINGTDADGPWKDVVYYSNSKLYFGAAESTDPVDAEGYPLNLNMNEYLSKY